MGVVERGAGAGALDSLKRSLTDLTAPPRDPYKLMPGQRPHIGYRHTYYHPQRRDAIRRPNSATLLLFFHSVSHLGPSSFLSHFPE